MRGSEIGFRPIVQGEFQQGGYLVADGFEVISDVLFAVQPPSSAVDVDGSGRVDGFDLARLARAFGTTFSDPNFDPSVDLDGDGDVDGIDLANLANSFAVFF